MKFFTADTHFGDSVMIRAFPTLEEHDAVLMEGINSKVSRNDELYIIGDFSSQSEMVDIVQRLEKLGYSPYFTRKNEGTFRLFSGAFATRKSALEQYDDLKANGIRCEVVDG